MSFMIAMGMARGGKPRQWFWFSAGLLIGAMACQAAVAQSALPGGRGRQPTPPSMMPPPGMRPGGMTPLDLSKPEEADPNEVAPEPEPGCEELPLDKLQKKNVGKINAMLMAGQFPAGTQTEADFDDFYTKYFLAQWTHWENVNRLPDFRGQLRSSHLGRHSNGTQVHDHLNQLVLDFMSKLAAGPYCRAVRLNAMLMIGELNAVETPPAPLPEALKVLVATVDSDKVARCGAGRGDGGRAAPCRGEQLGR